MNQTIFVTLYTVAIIGGVLLLLVTPWGGAEDWSAIAAWVAIAVNMLGLLFIWQQLKSNQGTLAASVRSADAASAAATTALLDSRAWVKLDVAQGGLSRDEQGKWHFTLQVSLQNVGKTPALHVAFRAEHVDMASDIRSEIAKLGDDGSNVGVTLFPSDKSDFERIVVFDDLKPTQLIGCNVRYRLPSGGVCDTPALYILFFESGKMHLRLGLQEDLTPT